MEWNRGPTIGRGSTATVSIATAAATGELFAVKSAELSSSSFLQREKELLSQLSSPHIVEYRGDQITYENDTPFYNLFMEYVPGGSISDLIKKNGGSIDESSIRFFTHQILLGLNYLHDEGIVHCDIKGQNLLIGKDGIKIADLGCAKRVSATSAFSGTPAFMAPEVARGEEQSFPADVWALGCTVIEMAAGSHPFAEEETPVSVLYRVGFSSDTPNIPVNISIEAKDFVKKCLETDPKQRLTVKELLQHPFVEDLRLNSPRFNELIRFSPTSVLDHEFWDSVEVPESRPSSEQVSSGPDSPAERVRGLIELSILDNNNWDSDEDWISVRIYEDEESFESFEIEPIVESQEFSSLLYLDTIAEYPNDVANFIDCFSMLSYTNILCMNVSDDSISVSLDLQIKLMKILFLFNSSVLQPLPLFLLILNHYLKLYSIVARLELQAIIRLTGRRLQRLLYISVLNFLK